MENLAFRRKVLRSLTWQVLADLSEHFRVSVDDGRLVESHVRSLAKARVELRAILERLLREDLQSICADLRVDARGREKALLIERILALAPTQDPARRDNRSTQPFVASPTKEAIRIEVWDGDATEADVDILALKFAAARHGLDREVHARLLAAGVRESQMTPAPRQSSLVPTRGTIGAPWVLFVGTPPLSSVMYPELATLARDTLSAAIRTCPDARTIGLTLHGANYGLDEREAFAAMLIGLEGAASAVPTEKGPVRVAFIERKENRAKLLRESLAQILPSASIFRTTGNHQEEMQADEAVRAREAQLGAGPHVFVAMPFNDGFQDVYDYAIKNAVSYARFLCERADVTAFTGDIVAHVRERIRTARLLIADLSTANANVYLEVGYAWGCGVPCVLLIRDGDKLLFDVQGQRCIEYKSIKDLEIKLSGELKRLARDVID